MKTTSERSMTVAEISAKVSALNIFMNCLNTALVLLGIGFVLIKLSLDKMADSYTIALFIIAGVLTLVSCGVMLMITSRVNQAIGKADDIM